MTFTPAGPAAKDFQFLNFSSQSIEERLKIITKSPADMKKPRKSIINRLEHGYISKVYSKIKPGTDKSESVFFGNNNFQFSNLKKQLDKPNFSEKLKPVITQSTKLPEEGIEGNGNILKKKSPNQIKKKAIKLSQAQISI